MGCLTLWLLTHILCLLSLLCNILIFGVDQNVMGPLRARGMFSSFDQEELALSFNWPQRSHYILNYFVWYFKYQERASQMGCFPSRVTRKIGGRVQS